MITRADLARELDVDEDAVRVFVDQLDGDPDLVDDNGDLTDSGADLIRVAFTAAVPGELDEVAEAAAALEEAEQAATEARAARDAAIRRAVAHGSAKTAIAAAAGVSREYLYRVL